MMSPLFDGALAGPAWLGAGVLASTAWNLSVRRLMKEERDERAAAGASNLIGLAGMGLAVLVLGPAFAAQAGAQGVVQSGLGAGGGWPGPDWASIPPVAWLAVLAAGMGALAFSVLTFKASKVVEASERAVVSRLNIFWILLFSAVLLGEELSGLKAAACLLLFAGAALCAYRPGHTRSKVQGLQMVVLAAAFSAALSTARKVGVGALPPLAFGLGELALLCIGLWFWIGRDAFSRVRAVWRRNPADLALNGLSGVVLDVAALMALTLLPVSVVVPVLSSAAVLTAILGGLLLGEKTDWGMKIAGALLAVAGVALMAGA